MHRMQLRMSRRVESHIVHVVSRREVPLPMRRKRSSMMTHAPNGGSHRSALLDDDALGRSPRSVAAKARCAYLVKQITGGDTFVDAIPEH